MNKDKIMVILSKIFSSLNLTIRTISAFSALCDLDWYKTRPNLRHARSVDLFMIAIVKGVTGVMFTRPN